MSRLPSYSVIICTYTPDRWDDLCVAIQSVRQQEPRPHNVIVVVDHHEVLVEHARSNLADCSVLENTEQRGLSGARNSGVAAARGDIVVFLDDDARCDPGWAEHMLRPYIDATVVGVGGHVEPDWRAPRPSWLPDEFLWVVGCSYRGQPRGEARVRNGIGANLSFRRSVLERIGGFNSLVGRVGANAAGCEETELSLRATRSVDNGCVVLSPMAVVRHAVPASRLTRKYFRDRCRAEGRSKAVMSVLAGEAGSLSTERSYVTRALPAAVVRGLTPRELRRAGGRRSWAVVEGALLTAFAYLVQRVRQVPGAHVRA